MSPILEIIGAKECGSSVNIGMIEVVQNLQKQITEAGFGAKPSYQIDQPHGITPLNFEPPTQSAIVKRVFR